MRYEVLSIPPFDRQLKRLAKKYPSLRNDFSALLESLEWHPEQGKSLGRNCFKIRMAIASKRKGKSGGARIIINFVISKKTIFLIAIL